MDGLLDYIFSNLDIEGLKQREVMEYLNYIQEITPQLHRDEDKIKFLRYRLRLTQRLAHLDGMAHSGLDRVHAGIRPVIASKKAKY